MIKRGFRIFETFYDRVLVGTGEIGLILILLSVIDIWWGFILFRNASTLANSEGFRVLSGIFDPIVLAVITISLGLGLLISWLMNLKTILEVLAFIQITLWCIVAYSILLSNFFSTGTGVYLTVGLKSIALYLRLRNTTGGH